jgi:hypothetical protein
MSTETLSRRVEVRWGMAEVEAAMEATLGGAAAVVVEVGPTCAAVAVVVAAGAAALRLAIEGVAAALTEGGIVTEVEQGSEAVVAARPSALDAAVAGSVIVAGRTGIGIGWIATGKRLAPVEGGGVAAEAGSDVADVDIDRMRMTRSEFSLLSVRL